MPEFQFAKSQRVIVPADRAGAEGVQGVVTANAVHLGREPHYEVQWPSSDSVGDKGDLKMLCTDVSESELITAQPPKMIMLSEAQSMVDIDRKERAEAYLDELHSLTKRIERLQAAAKRRAKSARKPAKSRKRR